jgi:hypothetical protein
MFIDKLIDTAKQLVSSFNPVHPELGLSSAHGKDVHVPTPVNRTLVQILRSLEQGADKEELVPRIIEQLVQTRPVVANKAVATGFFGAPPSGPRQKWANQIANQVVEPLQLFYPRSLNDPADPQSIAAILLRAQTTGSAVKAAGSGHSYSDVATTPDFLINTHGYNRVASPQSPLTGQLSPSVLRSPLPLSLGPIDWKGSYEPEKNHALIEMEAGVTIHDLNQELLRRNLGLMNMGGYDGQTIIGATSTSTHGSGITLPPFPDMVRSLVLATTGRWNGPTVGGKEPTDGVYFYRIEPKDGITDPAKYSDPLVQLVQDDDCFHAAICSMGCFGVIYSVVFEVMQLYWLEENRAETTLDKLMSELQANPNNPGHFPDVLQNTRNYEVLIHPYPMQNGKVMDMDPNAPPETYYPFFKCLVTKRNIVARPTNFPDNILGRSGHRNIIAQILSIFKVSFEVVVDLINLFPALIPFTVDTAMGQLVDDSYINYSFDIYNLGLNQDAGFAAEVGFSLQDAQGNYTPRAFKEAVDRIHRIAQRARQQGEQYQTSPFSLRFVKSSNALLSMMNGMNTAMIEMDMLTGTYAGPEIMYRYETSMYSIGGRPHWGLDFDNINGGNNLLGKMYPTLDRWLGVYRQFNARGTFNSSFTNRVGFTVFE